MCLDSAGSSEKIFLMSLSFSPFFRKVSSFISLSRRKSLRHLKAAALASKISESERLGLVFLLAMHSKLASGLPSESFLANVSDVFPGFIKK